MYSLVRSGDGLPHLELHKTTLADLGPGFKAQRFATKMFHDGEEIGIGNVSKIEPFIALKKEGMNLPVSCIIFSTQEIVYILLQDIEFKDN